MFYLNVEVFHAKNLKSADVAGKSDPYCEVFVNEYIRRTQTVSDSSNPVWNAKFVYFLN